MFDFFCLVLFQFLGLVAAASMYSTNISLIWGLFIFQALTFRVLRKMCSFFWVFLPSLSYRTHSLTHSHRPEKKTIMFLFRYIERERRNAGIQKHVCTHNNIEMMRKCDRIFTWKTGKERKKVKNRRRTKKHKHPHIYTMCIDPYEKDERPVTTCMTTTTTATATATMPIRFSTH